MTLQNKARALIRAIEQAEDSAPHLAESLGY